MRFQSFWDRTDWRAALILSCAAVGLGAIGAVTAFARYRLIMLFTSPAFSIGQAADDTPPGAER